MRVLVISEFYPRRGDPVLGIWAHRQALAARDAGAQVRVLVLHRLVPPRSSFTSGALGSARALADLMGEPHKQLHDGLDVTYVRYVSPPRSRSYHAWGAWAAPALAIALRRLRRDFPYELVHAHNAVPAADAVRRTLSGGVAFAARLPRVPLVVSVHGGDVLYTAPRSERGSAAVRRALGAATLVLANSQDIAKLTLAAGARQARVVHLGADLPAALAGLPRADRGSGARSEQHPPSLVTVGHLVARKRHADVIRAVAVLAERHPTLRYTIVGDGPERLALQALAKRLGVEDRVELRGQLPHAQALEQMRTCTVFAMPSTEEAFGVAYIEAMAAGLPAIGCRGEPGPEEIAAAGDGLVLVPPGDIERLVQRIDELLSDRDRLREASLHARETVAAHFTWKQCGEQTLAAYKDAKDALR